MFILSVLKKTQITDDYIKNKKTKKSKKHSIIITMYQSKIKTKKKLNSKSSANKMKIK